LSGIIDIQYGERNNSQEGLIFKQVRKILVTGFEKLDGESVVAIFSI